MGRNVSHIWKSESRKRWYVKNRKRFLVYCKKRMRGKNRDELLRRQRAAGKRWRDKQKVKYGGLYGIWTSMIQRCRDPKVKRWKHYGGRGIKVCPRWRKFENFLADMGPRPVGQSTNGHRFLYSLDRWPDPDGNYELGNVRWATPKEQWESRRKSGTQNK
jgi:hypothetical protein